jgi:hypothetical protein
VLLGLSLLAFFDPDGSALELTAPISDNHRPLDDAVTDAPERQHRTPMVAAVR